MSEKTNVKKYSIKMDVLKTFLSFAGTFQDEIKVNITTKGWELKTVNPAHTSMGAVTISKNHFEQYGGQFETVGIDVGIMLPYLKRLITHVKGTIHNVLDITFDKTNEKIILECNKELMTMRLVDTNGITDPTIPNLGLPIKIKNIDVKIFKRAIKESLHLSTQLLLKIESIDNKNYLMGIADDSEDNGGMDYKLPICYVNMEDKHTGIKSLFTNNMLDRLLTNLITGKITLEMDEDYPLRLTWILHDDIEFMALLAPRIEDD